MSQIKLRNWMISTLQIIRILEIRISLPKIYLKCNSIPQWNRKDKFLNRMMKIKLSHSSKMNLIIISLKIIKMTAFANKKLQLNKKSQNLFSSKMIIIHYVSKAVFHQQKKWLK